MSDIDKKLFVYPLHSYCLVPEEDKTLIKYKFKQISKQDAIKFYKATQEIEFVYKGKDFYGEKIEDSFKYARDLHAENSEKEK
jgi:uncharacterized protein YcaQ